MTNQEIIVEKWDAPWCDKCHCFHWHLGVNWLPSIATANIREVGEIPKWCPLPTKLLEDKIE